MLTLYLQLYLLQIYKQLSIIIKNYHLYVAGKSVSPPNIGAI